MTYVCHYRTGGWARFRWHETFESLPFPEALASRIALQKMGYEARVVPAGSALPTTFEHYEQLVRS